MNDTKKVIVCGRNKAIVIIIKVEKEAGNKNKAMFCL